MSQQRPQSHETCPNDLSKSPADSQNISALLSTNSSFLLLFSQNQILLEENRLLRAQAEAQERERAEALAENRALRSQAVINRDAPKRKYSKRRSWLQKKFKCPHDGCYSAYSSKIALNLHIRKRHALLKLEAQ